VSQFLIEGNKENAKKNSINAAGNLFELRKWYLLTTNL
jgi:hypothetical protein